MTTEVRLSVEYLCHPTWVRDPEGFYDDVPPARLPVSAALAADIEAWADVYERTYVEDDPASSGFTSAAEARASVERGRTLAERLRAELDGSYTVTYYDRSVSAYLEI